VCRAAVERAEKEVADFQDARLFIAVVIND
jgi:hypothetical protein